MTIFIKNMVCNRCILTVNSILEKQGIIPAHVALGEVKLADPLSPTQEKNLREDLESVGFELLDDQRTQLIDKVKTLLLEKVQTGEFPDQFSIVKFIGSSMHRDYSAISKLFTAVEGITIEQYFILLKIEKVKELLVYNELNLSEIAFQLGYSSVSYLSNQFKRVTGMNPSTFKQSHSGERKMLDHLQH